MTDAGRRHHTTYLYWDGMEIVHRIDDPRQRPDGEEIARSIGANVPAPAWRDLMEAVMRTYEDRQARTDNSAR